MLGIAPQFSRFISEVELQKGIYTYYSLSEKENYKFNIDSFIEKITDKITMIYIDNPNNPTGQIINIYDIEKICKIANEKGIYILVDEAYGDYMDVGLSAINLVNKYGNLIVIKSSSKVYGMANERVGYIIADKEIIETYDIVSVPFPFSEKSMKKFIRALSHRKTYLKKIEKVSKYKEKTLNKLNISSYLYTDMKTPIFTVKSAKYENLSKEFARNNIIVEGCDCFINLDKKYVRIRINKQYKKVIKKIKKILY